MLKGFREFLLRGNVVDLAVAVVIGAAFNAIVDKFVTALINPIIGMVFNADSLDGALLVPLPGGGALAFGTVIAAIINFLIVAAIVYFVFVLPMNKLRDRITRPKEDETSPSEQELLTEIRDLMRAQVANVELEPAEAAAPAGTAPTGAVPAEPAAADPGAEPAAADPAAKPGAEPAAEGPDTGEQPRHGA